MSKIIHLDSAIINNQIDVSRLRRSSVDGLILPSKEHTDTSIVAADHTSEPIKSPSTISEICNHLIANSRWRDYMLFVVGINFGLRVSDLRLLRFSDIINTDFTFKDSFPVFEIKTRNTRKAKKNRYITINDAVINAVTLFLTHTDNVSLSDYLFRSISNNGMYSNEPINRKSIDRILKGINDDLNLGIHMSTHTLRKTFCYHQMVMCNNDPRKLLLLSKMLGHSSVSVTLDYIGITSEEISEAYKNLNLGLPTNRYINSYVYEENVAM